MRTTAALEVKDRKTGRSGSSTAASVEQHFLAAVTLRRSGVVGMVWAGLGGEEVRFGQLTRVLGAGSGMVWAGAGSRYEIFRQTGGRIRCKRQT